jgi:hypothetical protein
MKELTYQNQDNKELSSSRIQSLAVGSRSTTHNTPSRNGRSKPRGIRPRSQTRLSGLHFHPRQDCLGYIFWPRTKKVGVGISLSSTFSTNFRIAIWRGLPATRGNIYLWVGAETGSGYVKRERALQFRTRMSRSCWEMPTNSTPYSKRSRLRITPFSSTGSL